MPNVGTKSFSLCDDTALRLTSRLVYLEMNLNKISNFKTRENKRNALKSKNARFDTGNSSEGDFSSLTPLV